MRPELKEQIEQAAAVLRQYGATAVFLFGSAAEGEENPRDVDMAVEGLPAGVFFHAYALAARCLDLEMDLIPLDRDTPFTKHLRVWGKLKRVG